MTKIATKLKSSLTGVTYEIGTVGTEERVGVKLTASASTVWTELSIVVQNLSTQTSTEIALSASGECSFKVAIGTMYQITFPIVDGFNQPSPMTFTASLASRSVNVEYNTTPQMYEMLIIKAKVTAASETVDILEGYTVYAQATSGESYTGEFNASGQVSLSIPYGKEYTLHLPTVGGFYHDNINVQHIAGVQSRTLQVNYIENTMGVCAIASDGTVYNLDELAEGIEAGTIDASDIIAGSYNDTDLANADRKDGSGNGCGFCWKLRNGTTSGQWNSANAEADTTKMPFVTSDAAALLQCCGGYNSSVMIETATGGAVTVATTCAEATLTINEVDRSGFVPAYGQMRRLVLNRTDYERLYSILGLTAPAIWSGNWWTSCQYNASYGVNLSNGGFYTFIKNYSTSVLVAFDL